MVKFQVLLLALTFFPGQAAVHDFDEINVEDTALIRSQGRVCKIPVVVHHIDFPDVVDSSGSVRLFMALRTFARSVATQNVIGDAFQSGYSFLRIWTHSRRHVRESIFIHGQRGPFVNLLRYVNDIR